MGLLGKNTNVKNVVAGREKPSAFLVLALAFILYIWDYIFRFDGFDFASITSSPLKLIVGIPLNIFLFVNVFLFFMRPAGGRILVSRFFFTAVILDIMVLGGFRGAGVGHLLIPLIIWFLWARNVYEDEAAANMIIGGLMIFDYVFYGGLQYMIGRQPWADENLIRLLSNRLIFPVWGYYALFTAYQVEKDPLTSILLIILLGTTIFYLVDDGTAIAARMGYLNKEMENGLMQYWTVAWERFWGTVSQFPERFKQSYDAQLEYATGGYYNGQVEENVEEPLGVFIENLLLSNQDYFEDETVILWANLRVNTLKEKPIGILMNCTTGDSKNKKSGQVEPDYYPGKPINFNITSQEEEGIQCKFPAGNLAAATHTLTLSAEFNFETLGYLKTYFMDIDRKQALARNAIDPLDQYGIVDKNPTAKFTNGPIRIGIGTSSQLPVGISKNPTLSQQPRLGITIENQWGGKIKNITNIIVMIPTSMRLEQSAEGICNGWFEEVGINTLDDALQDSNYRSYKMTESLRKDINKKPIDTFITRICTVEVDDVDEILGNTPVATHYYRVYAEYIYSAASTISVTVKKTKNTKTELLDCIQTCQDDDGCFCKEPSCTQYNKNVTKGQTCEGAASSGAAGGDPIPSNLEVIIDNDGDGSVDSSTATLEVTLVLKGDNRYACHYSNDGSTWPGGWELPTGTKEWVLANDGQPTKTVYYECQNRIGEKGLMDQVFITYTGT